MVTELPSLWGVDVVPDSPPEILWKNPDTRQVSHDASIDLASQVNDDLGLVSVTMFAARSGGQASADQGQLEEDGVVETELLYSGGLWETADPSENKRIQVGTN